LHSDTNALPRWRYCYRVAVDVDIHGYDYIPGQDGICAVNQWEGRLIYEIWGTEVPQWSPGAKPRYEVWGTKSPLEAHEYLLNFKTLLLPELNAAFTVISLLMSITTLIKFEVTLLTRLASGCCRCGTVCASLAAVGV